MKSGIPSFLQKSRPPSPRVAETQSPAWVRDVISAQVKEYQDTLTVENADKIPGTNSIPLNTSTWIKIPDVICVFVDMKNSTQLSATVHDKSTSRTYQLFTGTAVRMFNAFESPYIDVRGDGVFALFNHDQPYTALAAAVSFKTFAREVFTPLVQQRTTVSIGAHIGIDQKTVLVRKLGLKRHDGRTDRQNEVWAGKPVNMASKLASRGEADELIVSDRYYARIDNELARLSCGCPYGTKSELWQSIDLTNETMFDFNTAWRLGTRWCVNHGEEYCNGLLRLDGQQSK